MSAIEFERDFPLARNWQWKPLLGWTAAAILLVASWLLPVTSAFWDGLDIAMFRGLNGTVAWDDSTAIFWAITGGRQFDAFAILTILVTYLYHVGHDDLARFRHGMAFGVTTAILLLAGILLLWQGIALPRPSPSLAFDDYLSIKTFVPWSTAPESSETSFPADRATLMMVLTVLWWRGFGWRLGLWGAALTILLAMPRLAAGAHWMTDASIGGGAAALAAMALVTGTPIVWHIYRTVRRPTDLFLSWWAGFMADMSPDGQDNVNPTRQVLRGMCVGAADLVPGVSGGTLALILGIYKRLIGAIANVDKVFVQLILRREFAAAARHIDLMFLLPLGIGVVLSLIIFSRVVPLSLMLTNLPEIMFGFFFGLIAASIVGLIRHIDAKGASRWAWMAFGTILGVLAATLVPIQTPDAGWFIFLCGMIAVAAMLVPGVSGSFVLLVLGKYTDAIDALGRLDLSFLLPLGAGVIAGALTFSRAISWLLEHFYRQTILTVIGVLIGSLVSVWPFKDRQYEMADEKMRLVSAELYFPTELSPTVVLGFVAILVGILLYRLLDRLAQHAELDEPANS